MSDLPGGLLAAVLGLVVGSFLNVCIYRLPRGESPVTPRSRCTRCGRPLTWFENIPVASFLALGGRCRTCGVRISAVYPLVELLTAAMFVTAYVVFEPGWLLVSRLVFGCALIVLFVVDLEHRILPNVITLPGIVVGLVFSLVTEPGWISSLIGLLTGGGLLLAIAELYYRLRGEEGMGMGDVKMLAMIGAFLGWKLMVLTLVISCVLGALVGLGLIVTKRGTMKYALPFGTFLAIGALVASIAGDAIVEWYVSFYRM